MSIPRAKIDDLISECEKYAQELIVTKKQWRAILGKLLHVSYIVSHVRLFVNRLLVGLRGHSRSVRINKTKCTDLLWLHRNLADANSIVFFNKRRVITSPIQFASSDSGASLTMVTDDSSHSSANSAQSQQPAAEPTPPTDSGNMTTTACPGIGSQSQAAPVQCTTPTRGAAALHQHPALDSMLTTAIGN